MILPKGGCGSFFPPPDWLINSRLLRSTRTELNACISLQASVLKIEAGDETAAGSGCCRQRVRFRSSTRRHNHARSTDHRPCHISTKVAHSFKKKKNKETQKRRYKPHRHTIPFLSTVQLLRLKKKHKNKLHNSFFCLFLQPCVPGCVFFKSVFVL